MWLHLAPMQNQPVGARYTRPQRCVANLKHVVATGAHVSRIHFCTLPHHDPNLTLSSPTMPSARPIFNQYDSHLTTFSATLSPLASLSYHTCAQFGTLGLLAVSLFINCAFNSRPRCKKLIADIGAHAEPARTCCGSPINGDRSCRYRRQLGTICVSFHVSAHATDRRVHGEVVETLTE